MREHAYHWQQSYRRDSWLDMICTHSDHLALPPEQLTQVLDGIGAAVDSLGGTALARYGTHAVFARVAS